MKALKKLLVVVMVMSLVVHPAFVDVVFAIDYEGTEGGGEIMPEGADLYQKVQDAVILPPPPPEPDPVLVNETASLEKTAEASEDLAPIDQETYEAIFGTTPVTVKVTPADPDQAGASARYDYYDKDGNLVGSMYYDNSNGNAQTFVDKDNKKIDIAQKLNQDTVTADQAAGVIHLLTAEAAQKVLLSDKLSADKVTAILASDRISSVMAANLLYAIKGADEKKVTDILAKLDTVSLTKAADIRGKIGVGSNDITKMLPDVAAEYLSKLEPAKAAVELAKLDAYSAAAVIASSKMSSEAAAKIFGAMASDKVAEILSSASWWRVYYETGITDREIAMCPPAMATITAAKAAEILGKMTTDQAAAILGNDKMNASMAGDILENTEAKTAGEILNKMDTGKAAGVLATVATEKAVNILAGMDATKAAGIIASDKIDSTTAANILYALKSKDEAQLNKVLTALDTANKTKSDDIKAKIGVGSNDITKMIPDAAADYLSKLDTAKAAVELAKLSPSAALAIIASTKMSAETAAKIFGAMAADKVAEILSASSSPIYFDVVSKDGLIASGMPRYIYTYLDPAKAAQILGNMTKDQAAAILGSSKMENWTAGSIISNMETAAAVEILNKMDTGRAAEILSSTNIDVGAKIISAMTTDQAVKILGSDKMNSKWSAYILTQVKTETAVAILNKLDKAVAATIFSGMDTAAAATIAGAMDAKDVAAIFANDKLSVDAASQILYATDDAKATSILQQLDLVNSAKSADLRAKLGIGSTDISKMLPEVAAEYLSKMDPAKAADELLKLDPEAAGAILASNKLSAEQTAKIFEAMDADKAASIMSSSNYRNTNYNKSAEVLANMDTDKAVKILSSANMNKATAGFMLSNMATDAAIKIVSKLDVDTAAACMNSMWNDAGGKILSGLDADFAAKILNSANLSVTSAGYILSSTETTAAANILAKLVALNTPRAAEVLNYTAAYNATACAEIVNGLSTYVAAQIFGNANMSAEMAAKVLSNDKISAATAAAILSKVKATDAQKVTDILTKLDATNKVKADQIRTLIDKAWLNDLENLTPEDAAAKINAYVVDEATAKEAADALAKMDPVKAGLILSHYKLSNETIGRVLSTMDAAKAADILFAQAANSTEPAVGNMRIIYILQSMSPDKAAAIIDTYCASSENIPARVEQIFRKMVPADSANIFASDNMSADVAADIISAVKAAGFQEKADSILAAIDSVNKVKADQIREKIALGTDIGTLTPDAAAELLSKLDPAVAAAKLADLAADKAAAILGSTKMTAEAAAKILDTMDADKAVEILTNPNITTIACAGQAPAKQVEIIAAMDPAKAAKILESSKLEGTTAATILNSESMSVEAAAAILDNMDPVKAAALLNTPLGAVVPGGIAGGNAINPYFSAEKMAGIFSAMENDKAAAILSNMNAGYAATAVNALSEETAVKILGAMDAAKVAGILLAQDDNGPVSPAYHKTWDVISADTAAKLLSKLGASKVAQIFGALPADGARAAQILASVKISVDTAAKILNKLQKSDPDRVEVILNKLASNNQRKANQIENKMDHSDRHHRHHRHDRRNRY